MSPHRMSEQELADFSSKLETFGASLSPAEASLFRAILETASGMGREEDVEGHFFHDPAVIHHVANSLDYWHHLVTIVMPKLSALSQHAGAHPNIPLPSTGHPSL